MPKPRRLGPVPYWWNGPITLYHGDCINILNRLPSESVDLAFADPPFNIGLEYDSYDDNLSKRDYLKWTERWLYSLRGVIKASASVYVSIGTQYQAEMKVLLDRVGLYWRNTLVWHYTFGPRQEGNYTPSWVAIHYYTVSPSVWTWNADEVRVPSARELKYNDARAKAGGKVPDNVWVLLPNEYSDCFLAGQNAMLESRVCGTFKERTPHPCQMPEAVLSRIIKASSKPGDMVLDPFCGSGTTLAVALKNGRKGIGIELSEDYLSQIVVPRLKFAHREAQT